MVLVVRNPPCTPGNTGRSLMGELRSHKLQGKQASAPQLESPCASEDPEGRNWT